MNDDVIPVSEAVKRFLVEHPDVRNPALIFHGVIEANPDLCDNREIDLETFGQWVQYCDEDPPV